MPPYPQFYDSTSTTQISAIIAANVNAGSTFASVSYVLWNDKGAALSGSILTGARIRPVVFDGSAWATDGFPVLDEAWVEIRLTGIVSTGDPTMEAQTTGFTKIGANRPLVLRDIPQNCARNLDVQIVIPAGANNLTEEVHLEIVTDEASIVLPLKFGTMAGGGVLSQRLDLTARRVLSGRLLTAAGTDVVTVPKGRYTYDGTLAFRIAETLTLNQTSASGALAVGESYIATISQPAVGAAVATKGNRAGSPTAPAVPAGSILLGRVTVAYQGGGTSIINSGNVDTSAVVYGDYLVTDAGGLNVHVGIGQAITGSDTYTFATATSTLALTNNTTNYVWLRPDGTFSATTTSALPTQNALLLATVTTAAGAVSGITDSRKFIELPLSELTPKLIYWGHVEVGTALTWFVLDFDAILDSVDVDHGSIGSGSSTKIDIKTAALGGLLTGTTIYTSSGTSDLRPVTGAGTLRTGPWTDHEVTTFVKGTRFILDVVQQCSIVPHSDIIVSLHFRRAS